MRLDPSRAGALATAALHATAVVALLAYEPARSALVTPAMADSASAGMSRIGFVSEPADR